MTPHTSALAKLAAYQVIGLGLAFPTAGMSLVMNLTSIDDYNRFCNPEAIHQD